MNMMNIMSMNDCDPDKHDTPSETIVESIPSDAATASATDSASTNESLYPKLPELLCSVSKIIKEARHNDLMYPELSEIYTYHDLIIWIRNHYRLFYSVFQKDLLDIMASIPKNSL
jgi:hypothetical protein